MQKTGIIVLGSVAAMLPALAQASETVRLAEPDLAMEGSLMTALKNRHSTREYAAKDLTGADLSNLLWATAGVNRPDGRRTAPTALNLQEIGVYVVTAKGAFSYRHEGHELVKLTDKKPDAARRDAAGLRQHGAAGTRLCGRSDQVARRARRPDGRG